MVQNPRSGKITKRLVDALTPAVNPAVATLLVVPVGLLLAAVWIWCTVQAAMAGFDGRDYRYPVTLRLLS